jgi:hypothetical protein
MWKHLRKIGIAGGLVVLAGTAGLAGAAALGLAGSAADPQQRRVQQVVQQPGLPTVSLSGPCLASGRGYLRARIRGAIRLDIDLRGAQLSCEGGPRFDGSGLRMGFEGRIGRRGQPVRMVFGIDGAREGRPGRELPTNLTVIFEGERELFATQGNGNCTVDTLRQQRLGSGRAPIRARSYIVTAHGFCIAPANDLSGTRRILVTTFDFAGRADFERAPHGQDEPRSH